MGQICGDGGSVRGLTLGCNSEGWNGQFERYLLLSELPGLTDGLDAEYEREESGGY